MLSEKQTQQFKQHGYLVIENLIDEQHLNALKIEYSERMNQLYHQWYAQGLVNKAPDGLSFWQKIDQCYHNEAFDWYQPFDISLPHENITENTPMHIGPAIFAIVTNPNILNVVESLIGAEITSNPIQHVRIKPPQRNLPKDEVRAHITATDWHQDRGVTLEEADNTDMVTVWLAITDATINNGCLQVVADKPDNMLPHCPKTQLAIADGFIDETNTIPLPVNAGGAIFFHPLMPHSSLPNRSDGYRWSFDLRYNVTGQPTGRGQFPEFIARSKDNPATELRDWRIWEKRWLDARCHLANTPHIPQHRWTEDSPFCA